MVGAIDQRSQRTVLPALGGTCHELTSRARAVSCAQLVQEEWKTRHTDA